MFDFPRLLAANFACPSQELDRYGQHTSDWWDIFISKQLPTGTDESSQTEAHGWQHSYWSAQF